MAENKTGKTNSFNDDTNTSKEMLDTEKRVYRLKLCEIIATAALLLVIFISLIIVVVIQISNKTADYQEAATIVNTYTSIVLGFVAMTVSLIGMVLSFHNTIQTENSNLATTKEFSNLSNAINQLSVLEIRLEENLNKISDKTSDLEIKMGQFDLLKEQMTAIQNNLNQISNDLQSSIDRSKGNSAEGVTNLQPLVADTKGIVTDE